jgi:SAM-dependent methyltransferase
VTDRPSRPAWPRVQAFEFNDQPWTPEPLRDLIVESLGRTLRWARILDGVAAPFASFLERSGATSILDVGSGSGEPAALLAAALRRQGRPVPRMLLTDLFPRVEVWRDLARTEPAIELHPEPVDATAIPSALGQGRARTIINVLHHFPPPLAAAVLADAVRSGAPTFVVEGFERDPRGFLPFAPAGVVALAMGPLLSRKSRAAKALLAWATPAALLASIWDGFVSTLRVYTEAELRSMIAAAGGDPARWSYGTFDFSLGGRGTWFASEHLHAP